MHNDPAKESSIGYLVHEVARLYRRRFEDEARTHGVTLPQWRALAHIHMHAGVSQVALAGKIDTDPMTISGILDRLDKRGLIERFPDPNDSRSKLARLTAEGEQLVKTARSVADDLQAVSLDGQCASAKNYIEIKQRCCPDGLVERCRTALGGVVIVGRGCEKTP